MSEDTEKESAQVPESECLLANEDVKADAERWGEMGGTRESVSRLLDDASAEGRRDERTAAFGSARERSIDGRLVAGAATAITVPSIVIDEGNGCGLDDDPPPYSAIVPPNHVGWPFDFSAGIGYSPHTMSFCRADLPLAPFQTCRVSGTTAYRPDGSTATVSATAAAAAATVVQQASIALPFTPYRLFKLGSHRSLFINRNPLPDDPLPNTGLAAKHDTGKTRRYGAILMAGAVIIFLMALSLMVRFVVERSFWRG